MRHTFVRGVLALTLAAAVVACNGSGDGTGPPVAERVYVLQSFDGQPLPYDEYATASGDTTSVLSETLSLFGDGKATSTRTIRTVSGGGAATIEAFTTRYTFTIQSGQIVMAIVCPPTALCVPPRSGPISDAELVLQYAPGDPNSPAWRYTRAMVP